MTVRLAMSFAETELDSIRSYIVSDAHVIEQKMDGTRALIVIEDGRVRFLARNGGLLKHTAAMQHFAALTPPLASLMGVGEPGELVLDGEIIVGTGELFLFDLPYMRSGGLEVVVPTDPFWGRRGALEAVGKTLDQYAALNGEHKVRVVRSAATSREKQEMWERVNEVGAEGVMVKHKSAAYLPGVRTKEMVKVKLVKTADVVVIGVDRPDPKHGNFSLGIPAGDLLTGPAGTPLVTVNGVGYIPVGGCSAIGKADAQVGDVIEVAYLYWTGSNLYQPRMMKIRDDKLPGECGLDQFPAYSREAV